MVKASEVDAAMAIRTRRISGELPVVPTDKARLHVAMWKLANALGVQLDASRSDHELLEQIADACSPRLARAFREGYEEGLKNGDALASGLVIPRTVCPYDGTVLP